MDVCNYYININVNVYIVHSIVLINIHDFVSENSPDLVDFVASVLDLWWFTKQ